MSVRLDPKKRDIARLALQTAAAATGTTLLMRWLELGEVFLGVISAVLVLQTNRDETLGKAWKRIMGALVGTAVGLVGLALTQTGGLPWPLALSMLVMGALVAWRPRWRYGLVAVAGLTIASQAGFWETATSRTVAIALGAVVGIVTGFLLLPESAEARVRRQLGEALHALRDLLAGALEGALEGENKTLQDLHDRFVGAAAKARETASAIRTAEATRARCYRAAVHGAERLWHALIILSRVNERTDRGVSFDDERREKVDKVRRAACEAIANLADFRHVPPKDLEALDRLCRESRSGLGHGGEEDAVLDRAALIFGLDEVSRNLREVDRAIGALDGRS